MTQELYWHHLHVAVLGLVLEPQGFGWYDKTRAEQTPVLHFASPQLRARWIFTPLGQLEMTWETLHHEQRAG